MLSILVRKQFKRWCLLCLEKKILESMRESDHFSILFDDTTNCTVTEQLAVHGCYITNAGELRCNN